MSGQPQMVSAMSDAERPVRHDHDSVWRALFDLDNGTCPKCFGPIEPERLPKAELCLDCIVQR